MRVCKRFNEICKDSFFYKELNLKVSLRSRIVKRKKGKLKLSVIFFQPYWSSFSYSMLISLEPYCSRLTKLDLSWCGITKGILSTAFNM